MLSAPDTLEKTGTPKRAFSNSQNSQNNHTVTAHFGKNADWKIAEACRWERPALLTDTWQVRQLLMDG